jgi:hypothetical protein
MCRYAFKTYKSHFACFNCRKTFKQAPYSDLLQRIGKSQYYNKLRQKPGNQLTEKEMSQLADFDKNYTDREIKCPECGYYMADLGLDYKSPKKTAIKEWKIIEGLYVIGKSFHNCGCNGIGFIPKNHKDYEIYLKNVLHDYEKSITYYQNKTLVEYPDKAERIGYWKDKVTTIKIELARQGLSV